MPTPKFDALMLPILRLTAQKTWQMRELTKQICDDFQLTPEDREALLPSGSETVIASRVAWAKAYLKQAGLVEQPKRAMVRISDQGSELLSRAPPKIDVALLRTYASFQAFINRTAKSPDTPVQSLDGAAAPLADDAMLAPAISSTPEEQIASASNALGESLRDALLARVLEATPAFFERLILDLRV